ncbi:MAG: hypothetical protein ACXAAH_13485 [Promethearchaeota archaeon]|jgi:hypothetical protein
MTTSDGKYDLDEEGVESISEVQILKNEIAKLESEKVRMITIIKNNELEDLLEGEHIVLPEEAICINEIRNLKQLSDQGLFGSDEAKIFDIIAKNYRIIKGLISDDKSKKKKMSREQLGKLFEIVANEKK